MLRFIALTAALATTAAQAQERNGADSMAILRDGKVLSATILLPHEPNPYIPSALPEVTRIHELFVLHGSDLYLCYLIGNQKSGTPPHQKCFGVAFP